MRADIRVREMKKKRTGRDAVLQLRQEMLKLVSAYNAVGMFQAAASTQVMVISLNKFEEEHVITNMAWPPRLVKRDGMTVICPAEDDGTADSLFALHKEYV